MTIVYLLCICISLCYLFSCEYLCILCFCLIEWLSTLSRQKTKTKTKWPLLPEPGPVRPSGRASDHPTCFDPSFYRKWGDIRPTFNQSQPVVVHCSNKHSHHRTGKSSKPVIIHVHRVGNCTFTERGSARLQKVDLHVYRKWIFMSTELGSRPNQCWFTFT